MFSLSSPSCFIHRPVYRRREQAFGFYDPWTSCSGADRFNLGNFGRRPMPTVFLLSSFDVNDRKTGTKRKNSVNLKTSTKYRKEEDTFHVELDLEDLKTEEIDVSLDGNRLKIHAKSKSKHGITSSEVFKWYSLPENIDIDKLTSSLSRDGALHINAPFIESNQENSITNGRVASSRCDEQMDKPDKEEMECRPKAEIENEDVTQTSFTTTATEHDTNATSPNAQHIDSEIDGIEKEDVTHQPSFTMTATEHDTNDTSPNAQHDSEIDGIGFHVELPMEQFKPEHVHVSIDEFKLKIHAMKVDESEGHFVHEEVTKWFSLPSDVDANQLRSNIRDDGVLVINAPLRAIKDALALDKESDEAEDAQEISTTTVLSRPTEHAQEEKSQ